MGKITTLETLVQAKALIADPKRWIKNDYEELDGNGDRCFCSIGAIAYAANLDYGPAHQCEASRLLRAVVAPETGFADRDFACYNDEHTHDEVMTAFDKAIEKAIKNETFCAEIEAGLEKA